MKKIQDQLKTIAKTLTGLSRQIDVISRQADKLPFLKKSAQNRRTIKKASTNKKAVKAKAVKKMPAQKSAARPTVLHSVLTVIKRSKKGADMDTLRKKTGLGPRQLSNALYKLSNKGVIEAKSRGVYTSK